MVDINLLGEEERREERQREEVFARTMSTDTRELSDERPSFTFDKRTVREVSDSSRKIVYGVLFLIIAAGIAAIIWLMPKKTPATRTTQTQTEVPVTQPSAEDTTLLDTNLQPDVEPAVSTMSPLERSLVQSTQLGAWTIDAAAKSFSNSESRFELISYFADRRFLIQFVSPSEAAIGSTTQAVQQNLQPAELKALPPDRVAMNGRTMTKVLIRGSVSMDMSGPVQGAMQDFSYAQFIGWLKQLAKDQQLDQRSIDPRPSREEDGIRRTPVIAKFYGARNGVIGFLDRLAAANPSIDVAKLIVASADRRDFSDDFLELAMYFEFVELP
jgi:hypothetical protein